MEVYTIIWNYEGYSFTPVKADPTKVGGYFERHWLELALAERYKEDAEDFGIPPLEDYMEVLAVIRGEPEYVW